MKIIKKNQLALLVISLMLITAGYLNYETINAGNESMDTVSNLDENAEVADLGDAELVNANIKEKNKEGNKENNLANVNEEVKDTNNSNSDDYFAKSKLERNVMYSQMIERYQSIISGSSQEALQKGIAEEEINKINNLQNAIMISENLLMSKGFEKNVIFVNGDSISVIIGKAELTPDEVAQIQNIISRELEADVNNIHISIK